MSSVEERAHLSIGEVLSLLQEDFPDVSISKIRFLESQGLLDPERTPSGYRKFYDDDITRLRWILRQQRENFLPLKVIKERLANGQADLGEGRGGAAGRGELERALSGEGGPAVDEAPSATPPPTDAPADPAPVVVDGPPSTNGSAASSASSVAPASTVEPAAVASNGEAPAPGAVAPAAAPGAASPAAVADPVPPAPAADVVAAPDAPDVRAEPEPAPRRNLLDEGPRAVSLTIEELSAATGLLPREITELESFGMIAGVDAGGSTRYDEEALTIARLASSFRGHGVEPRHLRMFKMAAQREIGLFEQMLLPILRKTSPSAKREAAELATELIGLGDELRAAMLRQHLRDHIDKA